MIPQEIISLVDLALRDGIITYLERRTIEDEAIKKGVPSAEINSYMDQRLQSMVSVLPKDTLRHCPSCGGQVPLVADTCLFCGSQLTTSAKVYGTQGYAGDSEAARIIQQENQKTTNYKGEDSKTCPDCGAPLPLLSNVCPHCGHTVRESSSSRFDINNIIDNANKRLREMDKCKVSFEDVMKDKKFILFGVLGTVLFVLSFGGGIWRELSMFSFLFWFLSVKAFWQITKNPDTITVKADRLYYELKSEFEIFGRHTETLYGGNPEARSIMQQFNAALLSVEESRTRNRKNTLLSFVGMIALVSLVAMFARSTSDALEANREDFNEAYEIVDARKTLSLGVMENGRISTKFKEIAELAQYIAVGSKAELTFQAITDGANGLFNSQKLKQPRVRLNNVRLTSTGRQHAEADDKHLFCLIFDNEGNAISQFPAMAEESLIYKDSLLHTMPDASQISYRQMLRGERCGYYANFVSIDTLQDSNKDSLMKFFDDAASFIIFFTK